MWSTIVEQFSGVLRFFGGLKLKHTYCSVLWLVQLVHFMHLLIFFIVLQYKQYSDPLQCDAENQEATDGCNSEGRLFFVTHLQLTNRDVMRQVVAVLYDM